MSITVVLLTLLRDATIGLIDYRAGAEDLPTKPA